MIKKTINIESPAFIKTENEQIVITIKDSGDIQSLSAEDLGVFIVDNNQTVITSNAISKLMENNTIIAFCDKSHLPAGLCFPTTGNFAQTKRFNLQVNAKTTLVKALWKDIIKQKIKNQAFVLKKYGFDEKTLIVKSTKVKTGDSTNVEGSASQFYWRELFKSTEFKRAQDGVFPNNLLNYGYAIVRAITARAICVSGLHPSLGLFHKNVYNPFCLADDLMEPYRQFVDDRVYSYFLNPSFGEILNKDLKKLLLNVIYCDVRINKETHPLSIGIGLTVNSLNNCFSEKQKKLALPELCV